MLIAQITNAVKWQEYQVYISSIVLVIVNQNNYPDLRAQDAVSKL